MENTKCRCSGTDLRLPGKLPCPFLQLQHGIPRVCGAHFSFTRSVVFITIVSSSCIKLVRHAFELGWRGTALICACNGYVAQSSGTSEVGAYVWLVLSLNCSCTGSMGAVFTDTTCEQQLTWCGVVLDLGHLFCYYYQYYACLLVNLLCWV